MNLYSRLASLAQYQSEKIAVETGHQRLTYLDLDVLARRIAGRLRSSGVGFGDVVGLRLRDTPEHIAAFFAVLRLGAIVLPIDWRASRAEFDRVVRRFSPKVVLDDDASPLGWCTLSVQLAEARLSDPDAGAVAAVTDSPMGYSLTSGTTGEPKAMVVTHENLHARLTTRALEGVFSVKDRFLATLPLAYPAGREHAICLILLGATLVLFPSLFDPMELVNFVNLENITALALSPNATRALLNLNVDDGLLMPGLRVFVSTTGKLQPEERDLVRKRISRNLIDYYGSTGTGPITIISEERDGIDPTTVGRPVIGIEVEIVDDTGNLAAEGEIGRIRVRGPAVTTSTVGSPEANDEGFRDGWYYPGDLGKLGSRGLVCLHGRAADLIKRGGLMVHAQEVEQALRRHPKIIDAAVIGVPSEMLGQEVMAFVVVCGPLDLKEIIRHCRSELAPFKVPARIEFRDDLPRNPTGKVIKSRL